MLVSVLSNSPVISQSLMRCNCCNEMDFKKGANLRQCFKPASKPDPILHALKAPAPLPGQLSDWVCLNVSFISISPE